LSNLRTRRLREIRPGSLSASGIAEQRELAHHERGAADVHHRPVELSLVVREDAQLRDLLREAVGGVLLVAFGDAEQDAQTRADVAARRRPCPRDPLDDGLQFRWSIGILAAADGGACTRRIVPASPG